MTPLNLILVEPLLNFGSTWTLLWFSFIRVEPLWFGSRPLWVWFGSSPPWFGSTWTSWVKFRSNPLWLSLVGVCTLVVWFETSRFDLGWTLIYGLVRDFLGWTLVVWIRLAQGLVWFGSLMAQMLVRRCKISLHLLQQTWTRWKFAKDLIIILIKSRSIYVLDARCYWPIILHLLL